MSLLAGAVAQLIHMALTLAAAPLLTGLLRRMRARLPGRAGPPVMQPYRDLARLSRKQRVVADGASPLFRAAPFAIFAAVFAACALVPSFALGMASAPMSDLIVVAGLLGAARCALALAGMDAGTAFGGMGASGAMTFAAFGEPAFLMAVFALALLAGTTNLDAVAGMPRDGGLGQRVPLGLALCAALVAALVETGRRPVADPAACQEPAMVQEAMTLEYSGRDLALVELSAQLRLLLWMDLLGAMFAPFGMAQAGAGLPGWAVGIAAWAARTLAMAAALAVFETTGATMRLRRVPELLGVAVLLGLLAAALVFASQGPAA